MESEANTNSLTSESHQQWGNDLLDLTRELLQLDVRHDELDLENGFYAAETDIQFALKFIEDFIVRVQRFGYRGPPVDLEQAREHIRRQLDMMRTAISRIYAVSKEVDSPSFQEDREKVLNHAGTFPYAIETQLRTANLHLRLTEVEKLGETAQLPELRQKLENEINSVSTLVSEAKKHAASLASATSEIRFSNLVIRHETNQKWWLSAFIVFSGALAVFIALIVFWNVFPYSSPADSDNSITIIDLLVKKVLLISFFVIGMRVSLVKFNQERNLKIIYDHRIAALDLYRRWEDSIKDSEVKNALRLHIATLVLSDPETGYGGKQDSGNEITINPIVPTLESVAKKTT